MAFAGVIHEHHNGGGDEEISETEHHHEVDHKHATSHQSFKFHHFHAVPVYVKKEDQEFLKHPVEISGIKHNLKIVHPETEHHHGHGLTLENHSQFEHKGLGQHYDLGHAGSENVDHNEYGAQNDYHQYQQYHQVDGEHEDS